MITIRKRESLTAYVAAAALALLFFPVSSGADVLDYCIYDPGKLQPVASTVKLKVGDPAPDFTLQDLSGNKVSLSDFRDK